MTTTENQPVPLPPATDDALDLSRLERSPLDVWHRFRFGDGDRHVGYARLAARLEGGELRCVYDWCFHSEWGVIGDYERSRLALVGGSPRLLVSHGESNDGTSTRDGERSADGAT